MMQPAISGRIAGLGKVMVEGAGILPVGTVPQPLTAVPTITPAITTSSMPNVPATSDSSAPPAVSAQPGSSTQFVMPWDKPHLVVPAATNPPIAPGSLTPVVSSSATVGKQMWSLFAPYSSLRAIHMLLVFLVLVLVAGGSFFGYRLIHQSEQQTTKKTAPAATAPATTPITQPTVPKPKPKPATKPTPEPAPKPVPQPVQTLKPAMAAVAGKDTSYNLGVLVLKYFPVDSNGNINIHVTGDVGEPYNYIRQRTIDETNDLIRDFPKATTYLGYAYNNLPAVKLHVVATIEHKSAVPINATLHAGYPTYPDYPGIMNGANICNYVNNKGVSQVFLWAYQGPSTQGPHHDQPYLGISESKMSGVHDVSNSFEWNDMPRCAHSYVVYTFNYQRGTSEAFHSMGHQIEAEMNYIDSGLFGLFQGPPHPQTDHQTGRCGSVHNPPNSRQEYDYVNTKPQQSDCLDWTPDGLGKLTNISCRNWTCNDVNDPTHGSSSELAYLIWMWQNLPGRNNVKMYHGKQLRNWWDVFADFDNVVANSKRLTLN